MLRRRTGDTLGASSAGGKLPDGAFQAMDQIANWVRFADAKATVLTAGLGVLTVALLTNAAVIVKAIRVGGCRATMVSVVGSLAVLALLWTLGWLVTALSPRRTVSAPEANRFAWPTLTDLPVDRLVQHVESSDVSREAWRQVIDLSQIAGLKFLATQKAIYGFACLVVLCVATVLISVVVTS